MDKQTFYVTFGCGHPLAKYYVIVKAKDWNEACDIVKIQFARYGEIYTQDEWDKFTEKFGETYDIHYNKILAATIENYEYINRYKDWK